MQRSGLPAGQDHRLRRALKGTAIAVYCLAIFAALDFTVSSLAPGLIVPTQSGQQSPRAQHPVFHHTLTPRFEGVDSWGETRYRFVTNSLGFKDQTTREVPAKADMRRIVLIGDSFTEGIGVEFQDTFAGMLARAGLARAAKTDVLNAGVVSYSPTVYYAKIKYLLDNGVQFDEVVVLPDLSDIQDEAQLYFCIDEIPEYRAHCNPARQDTRWTTTAKQSFGQRHFILTDRLRVLGKRQMQTWSGNQKRAVLTPNPRDGWVIAGFDVGRDYDPLGVDGGIERAQRHMRALADLLAAHNIALSVAVYPWPMQLAQNDRDSRQVRIWRDFCQGRCKAFIDLSPEVFAAKDARPDWYERYFIFGDSHYSAEGHRVLFRALEKQLLPQP